LQCVMKLYANVLKISYFFYRIIDRITEFSFIIFSDFIHFMKCFILSTVNYHVLFFHHYQLYIAFYYSYINPFTINMCGAQVKNLLYIYFNRLSADLVMLIYKYACIFWIVFNNFLNGYMHVTAWNLNQPP